MSPTTWGWLVLAFPLAGTIVISLGWRILPGRSAGWIGTAAIGASFACAVGALICLQGHGPSTASSSPRCGTTRAPSASTRSSRSSSTRCRSS